VRETVGSLRAYFIVGGLFLTSISVVELMRYASYAGAAKTPMLVIAVFADIFDAILGITFFVTGVWLPVLLRKAPQQVIILLYTTLGVNIMFFALSIPFGINLVQIIYFAVGLLVVWYLLRNVRRLMREVQSAAATEGSKDKDFS
jgi:hypothetical protein